MGKAELRIEIDADLLAQAKTAGLSVEAVTEAGLRAALSEHSTGAAERARRWADENAEAIADFNRRISERGLLGDHFRKW